MVWPVARAPDHAHRGWVPTHLAARALAIWPADFGPLVQAEDAVDGGRSQLFELSANGRWVAGLLGGWRLERAGMEASRPVERYRELLARYPPGHWVHDPPPVVQQSTFQPWGRDGRR